MTVDHPTVTGHPVSLSAKPQPDGEPPIACTLTAGGLKGRLEEWEELLTHVAAREPLDDGVRAVFADSVPLDELMRLVAAERDCCQFFRFAITVDGRGVALEVRAPADGHAILTSLFGQGPDPREVSAHDV